MRLTIETNDDATGVAVQVLASASEAAQAQQIIAGILAGLQVPLAGYQKAECSGFMLLQPAERAGR